MKVLSVVLAMMVSVIAVQAQNQTETGVVKKPFFAGKGYYSIYNNSAKLSAKGSPASAAKVNSVASQRKGYYAIGGNEKKMTMPVPSLIPAPFTKQSGKGYYSIHRKRSKVSSSEEMADSVPAFDSADSGAGM